MILTQKILKRYERLYPENFTKLKVKEDYGEIEMPIVPEQKISTFNALIRDKNILMSLNPDRYGVTPTNT